MPPLRRSRHSAVTLGRTAGLSGCEWVCTPAHPALVRTRGDGRMTMAEPVRAHAQALLTADGRERECRHRHALILTEQAETISDGLLLHTRALTGRGLELADEFDAALHWSSAHEPELHRRLVAALGVPFYLANRLSTIADAISAWIARDDAQGAVSARLHIANAAVLISNGEIDGAVAAADGAAARYRRLGDQAGEAFAVAIQAQILNQTATSTTIDTLSGRSDPVREGASWS
jgi:hypothetical protein